MNNIIRERYTNQHRWVYQWADGNFKANHVHQHGVATDIWLSEGGGMTGKRIEYDAFLKSVIERLMVSLSKQNNSNRGI